MPELKPNARQRAHLRRENKKYPETLVPLPQDQWPPRCFELAGTAPTPLVGVWRSRRFLVIGFAEDYGIVRLSIQRTEWRQERQDFIDRISWDDLQRLKAEAGYGDRAAVEIFPPDVALVNVANMRHLWILPAAPVFMWKRDCLQ